jgi:D-alanyl-D-alanine carboxypeptidase
MVFQGNFFIHGWPYYPDGTDVASTYSGGCIRLSTKDAKEIYQMIKVGMPVIVSEESFKSDNFAYPQEKIEANVSAKSYLVADLKSRSVLASSEHTGPLPIASITKLMTALVAAEYINLDKPINVRASAMVQTSVPRLKAGESRSAYQLLYPLLAESSNEAAYALSDHLGRNYFVTLMNQKAEALGMKTAHFEDPAGIDWECGFARGSVCFGPVFA